VASHQKPVTSVDIAPVLLYQKSLEAISKKGFWFKIKAGSSFNPQAYSSMSRT
jgi:hypothetical protein